MLVLGLLLFVVFLFLISQSDIKTELAVKSASYLSDLNTVEIRILDDYEKAKQFFERVNQIIDRLNNDFGGTGVNIKKFELDEKNTIRIVSAIKYFEEYAPLIHTYNELIESSKELDKNDPESINRFYMSTLFFVSDVAFMQEKIIHKTVSKAVGKVNSRLSLERLKSICGNACYRFSLKKIYWAGREFSEGIQNKLYEFLGTINTTNWLVQHS